MRRLRVKSRLANYDVVVGRGAWSALRELPLKRYSSVFVLTERALWNRWGRRFAKASALPYARTVLLPPGETSKSLRHVERIASQLLEQGADRRALLIVFGGGVVGDVGGFVASTYMRGIDYVQAPTTVVAQVDSAVGGKTGVNVGEMKNLVGTFYPPRLVLADPIVLSSLDERAARSGLYEVAKHAILAGSPFFDEFEAALPSLRSKDAKVPTRILEHAVQVKVDVVSRDEREAKLRQVLNLGHTFGHALEETTRYRRFLHGEAVGWGLLAATHLAWRAKILGATGQGRKDGERIIRLVRAIGPLPSIRDIDPRKIMKLLPRDKKAVGGHIHWVLPERIGKVRIVADVRSALVEAALREVQKA